MGTGNLTGKKRQGRDERKEWLCSGRRMRKEMGMKGVSFYIFAALANKHRAMKQPVTAQGPEYTLATDDDVKIRRVSPYKRVNKEPNNPSPLRSFHVYPTRLPRDCHAPPFSIAAAVWRLPGWILPVSPLRRATDGKPLSFDPIWRRIQHIRKALYHSSLSSFSHNKTVTMSGNSEVEYLKSLVSQVRPALFPPRIFKSLTDTFAPSSKTRSPNSKSPPPPPSPTPSPPSPPPSLPLPLAIPPEWSSSALPVLVRVPKHPTSPASTASATSLPVTC